MIGKGDQGGDREGRAGRRLAWPSAPGTAVDALTAELAAGIDAAATDGRALALIELDATGAAAAMRLCERLAAHWQAAGLGCLVVDGHPLAPFFDAHFAGSPEGFTEILRYGLSPAAAAQERPHAAGLWIPAGGRWALPLESPAEPGLTLSRLLGAAERVLLLADASNAEGLLPALRELCHFQLQLDAAPPAPASPASVEAAAAPSAAVPTRREALLSGQGRRSVAPRRSRSRNIWPLMLLPGGALVLLLGIYLITGPWGGGEAPGPRSVERGGGDAFSPLPAPAQLPYAAPGRATDSTAPAAPEPAATAATGTADGATASGGPLAAGLGAPSGFTPSPVETAPAVERKPGERAPAATPRRRFEPASAWSRLLGAPGPFFVHLDSFRDSSVAAAALRSPGAQRLGARLAPALVEGTPWYRLWLGPFPDLPAAAACRDSLLDRAGEDYCRIVTATP